VKEPPPRAFLEKHVDEDRFLDFVSRRSPVWKERPLPATKQRALDLMLEQPNLIKRPILVAGSQVIFGFDKARYEALTQPGYRAIVRTGDRANW
jgi:arsenate reductase-like glutaredoxin family protein